MNFRYLIAASMLVLVASGGVGAVGADNSNILKEIDTLTSSHSYYKATLLLQKMHQQVGENLDTTLAAARLYSDMGLPARAEAEYRHALELNPNCTEACVALSNIAMQGLNTRRALEYARRAVVSNPHSTAAEVALSSTLVASGMLGAADHEVGKLLVSDPGKASVQYVAYKLAIAREEFPAAQLRLEEAVRLSPGRPDWLVDLSEVYKAREEYGAARQMLEKALKIDPYSLDALSKLAIVDEFYFHDYDQAVEQYKNILQIDPDSVTALAGLDRCKVKKNDIAGALKYGLQNLAGNFYSLFGSR